MNIRPIDIQCEATNCIFFNLAGTCNKAAQTGIIEISQEGDAATCRNFTSNQPPVKSE